MSQFSIVLLSFTAALGVTLAVTPLVVRLAWWMLALDRPDARKQHAAPVPRLGGAAVLAGFAAGVGVTLILSGYQGSLFTALRFHWIGWIAGIVALFLCGLWDDIRGMRPAAKLAVQIAAAVTVYVAGFRIEFLRLPGMEVVPLGLLAIPVTILWVVGVTNAVNLLDGLDGLAAGAGFLITATVAATSAYGGLFAVTVLSVALAGSLLGFLPYNFAPARIFLGDSGSQFLGFTLSVISIRGFQKSATIVAILAPALVLGLPILDTLLVIVRRSWRIQHELGLRPVAERGLAKRAAGALGLFQADREHIHHNLLELGFSQRKTVILLYAACAAFCAASLGMVAMRDPSLAVLLAVCVSLATVLIKIIAVRRRSYLPPKILATLDDPGTSSRTAGGADGKAGKNEPSSKGAAEGASIHEERVPRVAKAVRGLER